jgi:hypothetical protein
MMSDSVVVVLNADVVVVDDGTVVEPSSEAVMDVGSSSATPPQAAIDTTSKTIK